VPGASFEVREKNGRVLFSGVTNDNGESPSVVLDAPPASLSLDPDYEGRVYSVYDVTVRKEGFATENRTDVQVFDGIEGILPIDMQPLVSGLPSENTIVIPPQAVAGPLYQQGQEGPVLGVRGGQVSVANGQVTPLMDVPQAVAPDVIVPDYITVHLGVPTNSSAPRVRVRFIDYVKNVVSSEIYPTWPTNSIIANTHAIVSFAMNRVYTEWYRTRGYTFDITNSTTVDQYFVPGREIFANISRIVDGIFNVYVRRIGFRAPYFTEYCDGRRVTCRGMSQWGTVAQANRGLSPIDILRSYYPRDIELVAGPTGPITETYPGVALRLGSTGPNVRRIQLFLNRIAANYPLIPQIPPSQYGTFGPATERRPPYSAPVRGDRLSMSCNFCSTIYPHFTRIYPLWFRTTCSASQQSAR
jgi:hypothetical protein